MSDFTKVLNELVAYLKEPTGGWRVFLGTSWEGPRKISSWARWLFFPKASLSWREQRCRSPLLAFSGFSRTVKLLLPWLNMKQKVLTQSRITWDFRSCDLISSLFSFTGLLALLAMLKAEPGALLLLGKHYQWAFRLASLFSLFSLTHSQWGPWKGHGYPKGKIPH